MKLPRRTFLHLVAGAAALPAVSRIAWAQAYPSRPVRIIVGFAPGGTADIIARLMGQWLSERLGRPFVIENRSGGATNIATETVVRAPADGYTLLLVGPTQAINATTLVPSLHVARVRIGCKSRRAIRGARWSTQFSKPQCTRRSSAGGRNEASKMSSALGLALKVWTRPI